MSLSAAYHEFPQPNKGFDFHVYFMHTSPEQTAYAKELRERIRREFPELPVYQVWEKPIGPHPTGMFQVITHNPHQTGALFSWLVVNRGPCDVLVHPHTGNSLKDHAQLASWIGRAWPLNLDVL